MNKVGWRLVVVVVGLSAVPALGDQAPPPAVAVSEDDLEAGLPAISGDGAVLALPERSYDATMGHEHRIAFTPLAGGKPQIVSFGFGSDDVGLRAQAITDANSRLAGDRFRPLPWVAMPAQGGTVTVDGIEVTAKIARQKLSVVATLAGKPVGKAVFPTKRAIPEGVAVARGPAPAAYVRVGFPEENDPFTSSWVIVKLALPVPIVPPTPAEVVQALAGIDRALTGGDAKLVTASVKFPLPVQYVEYDNERKTRSTRFKTAAQLLKRKDLLRVDAGFLTAATKDPTAVRIGEGGCDQPEIDYGKGGPAIVIDGPRATIGFLVDVCGVDERVISFGFVRDAGGLRLVEASAASVN